MYSLLTQLGLTPRSTMLVMISVPVLQGIAFYVLLRHPKKPLEPTSTPNESINNPSTDFLTPEEESPLVGFKEKLFYIPKLLKYIIPLTLVYLFEYFINQGLVSFSFK